MNKYLGFVLGILIGSFSSIIFGVKIFGMVMLFQLLTVVIMTLNHIDIWSPLYYLIFLFFAIHNYRLLNIFATNKELSKSDRKEIAEEMYGSIIIQLVQLMVLLGYFTTLGHLIIDHRYIRAAIFAVIGFPLLMMLVHFIMGWLLIPISMIFAIPLLIKKKA